MSLATLALGGALVFAAIIGVSLLRSNHRHSLAASSSFVGDPLVIEPGHVISINGGDDWTLVCGSLVIKDVHERIKHMLDDTGHRWIGIEKEDDETTITLWTYIPVAFVQSDRGNLIYNGVIYTPERNGSSRYHSVSAAGQEHHGEVEYINLRGAAQGGDVFLTLERFDGGDWRHSVGHILSAQLLVTNPPTV